MIRELDRTTDLQVMETHAQKLAVERRRLSALLASADERLARVRDTAAADLKVAAQRVAQLEEELQALVERCPEAFRKPQSVEIDGVRFGWRKGKGRLELPADTRLLMKRMGRVLTKSQRAGVLKVKVSILKGALTRLPAELLQKLGVSITGAGSEAFVSYPKSSLQKRLDWWTKPLADDGADDGEEG